MIRNQAKLLSATRHFVKETLKDAEAGHDWFHCQRVYHLACELNKDVKADDLVVQLGAWLHDIADSKFYGGDESIGPKKARVFLESQQLPEAVIGHVENIIKHISYKGGFAAGNFSSPELHVIQDADRLDAMGAIGIARAFNYGGFKNRKLYDPAVAPQKFKSREEYKNSKGSTLNHFYEKLLKLKEGMFTEKAKQMAQGRHEFMEQYLEQFLTEWQGKI